MSREAGRVRERGPDSVWERYGWVMAVVWLVFLIYPILGLRRDRPPMPAGS
jgi:two-component system sensor histidine kinase DesK